MDQELNGLLLKGAAVFGVELDDAAVAGFDAYTAELLEWNRVMNLTAITEPREIVIRHYIDSLSLLSCAELPKGSSLADVGSGAGFPGIPVKLARRDIRLTAIDSLNKRVRFLQAVTEKLGLAQVDCLHLRAEEACRKPELRGHFDVVTARAVAALPVLAEICLPLLKRRGVFLAMKGPDAGKEAGEAKSAVALLGGEIEDIRQFTLPFSDAGRTIIVIRKTGPTKEIYPRISAKIAKNPLK